MPHLFLVQGLLREFFPVFGRSADNTPGDDSEKATYQNESKNTIAAPPKAATDCQINSGGCAAGGDVY
ncbi:protein of unknown function [Pseudorhizobium banfieldiae]|uniref:Uncharacterized protein n=1 Tax=Pseudorhizobium banfieldiae TaxID=1125847 RepID=L0NJN1_9HYPH|nr:protein of unknown function [Pseudorhizobium banfieldiae]